MRRVYLVPNIITAFGLACGLFVIFKVNMVEPGEGDYQVMYTSALLLMVAAIADFMDGALARVINAESEFGLLFDSLADAVSFGVAPSVLMLKSLSVEQGSRLSFLAATGAMIYSLCCILRLVRFNVKAAASRGNTEEMKAQKKNFTGLPVPAAAAAFVSANLLFVSPAFKNYFDLSNIWRSVILAVIGILLGYLMVSRWRFPSLKVLRFRVASFPLIVCTVIAALFILYGILHYFAIVLAILSWAYILIAAVLSIIRLIAGKKSKTLEEFEPDPEEFDQF